MEAMVSAQAWRGTRVFITGHTGFKGSWLAMWLHEMGAHVTGYSLAPEPISLFRQAGIQRIVDHVEGDIRDLRMLEDALSSAQPDIIFHLAAQPLVRLSYAAPVDTFSTNVLGTVHVLDAARRVRSVRAIVAVTSDKCYENREWVWPYREADPMGGHDPYSASKGAAEIVVGAYRRSYFSEKSAALLASVRAGNVIGGGDWAQDRLVPDIVRALLAGELPYIRSPGSIRPWQHVLDALSGYLLVGQALLAGNLAAAGAWNFGPAREDTRPVGWIADALTRNWGRPGWRSGETAQLHEALLLSLDCSKAQIELGWRPTLDLASALAMITEWHRNVANGHDPMAVSRDHLLRFREAMGEATVSPKLRISTNAC